MELSSCFVVRWAIVSKMSVATFLYRTKLILFVTSQLSRKMRALISKNLDSILNSHRGKRFFFA